MPSSSSLKNQSIDIRRIVIEITDLELLLLLQGKELRPIVPGIEIRIRKAGV